MRRTVTCGRCYPAASEPRESRLAAVPFSRLGDDDPGFIAVDETHEPVESAGLRSDAALFFPGR